MGHTQGARVPGSLNVKKLFLPMRCQQCACAAPAPSRRWIHACSARLPSGTGSRFGTCVEAGQRAGQSAGNPLSNQLTPHASSDCAARSRPKLRTICAPLGHDPPGDGHYPRGTSRSRDQPVLLEAPNGDIERATPRATEGAPPRQGRAPHSAHGFRRWPLPSAAGKRMRRPALALVCLLSSKAMLAACFTAMPPTARAAAHRRVPAAPAMGWLDDVVGKVKDATREVTVQHILLPSQSDARDLWRELEAAGVTSESFGRAAAARSTCELPSLRIGSHDEALTRRPRSRWQVAPPRSGPTRRCRNFEGHRASSSFARGRWRPSLRPWPLPRR